MAKAREVPGLDGDDPCRVAAANVVSVRSDELFEQSVNVLDTSDIERVHDMRVATRRLRAVLEIFAPCFEPTLHRSVLRDVRSLADALGERRDADVEIALLEGLLDEAAEADRGALVALIEELRVRQAEANESLTPYVAPKRLKKLRRRLKKLVKKAGR